LREKEIVEGRREEKERDNGQRIMRKIKEGGGTETEGKRGE